MPFLVLLWKKMVLVKIGLILENASWAERLERWLGVEEHIPLFQGT